jgi:hypothetical protein
MLLKKTTFDVSKLSRTGESNLNLSFLEKQPCFDTMLEIDNKSREYR